MKFPIVATMAFALTTATATADIAAPASQTVTGAEPQVTAQMAQTNAVIDFNIPAQSLNAALLEFADKSGIQVFFNAGRIADVQSGGVVGQFTADVALQQILAGTGVTFQFTESNVVTVQRLDQDGSGPLRLQQITVTGERVDQTLQRTASSVTVYGEDDIDRGNRSDVYRLIQNTPNITPAIGDQLPPIRGENSMGPHELINGTLFNSQPRSVLIVDDIARISSASNNAFLSSFDVEQVEVLRGPQTTNRGSNAIAGAYVVKTKDPTYFHEYEAFGQLEFNEFSDPLRRIATMANVPVIKGQVATRLTVDGFMGQSIGEIRDERNPSRSSSDYDRFKEINNIAVRNKWLVEPDGAQGLRILATMEYERGRDQRFLAYDGEEVSGESSKNRIIILPELVHKTEAHTLSANASYNITEHDTIRSISAYSRSAFGDAFQTNGTGLEFDTVDQRRYAQDLLYERSGENRKVTGVLGFSFQVDETYVNGRSSGNIGLAEATSRAAALFFDATYHVSDQFRVLTGSRVQRRLSRGILDVGTNRLVDDRLQETVFLPKLGMQYDLAQDHTVSLTARRGYNPGSNSIDTLNFQASDFSREFADTFELTYRGNVSPFDASFGATAFFNHFTDKQVLRLISSSSQRVLNVDKARSYGIEIDAVAYPLDGVQVNLGLGYLDTEVTDGGNQLEVFDNHEFGQDPDFTASIAVAWRPIDELEIVASGQYVSEYHRDIENAEPNESGDYFLLNLGVGYEWRNLKARAYVNNVFDRFISAREFAASDVQALPPRIIGVSLNATF